MRVIRLIHSAIHRGLLWALYRGGRPPVLVADRAGGVLYPRQSAIRRAVDMPTAFYCNPFESLHLSAEEKAELTSTADVLVRDAQTGFEHYIADGSTGFHGAQWSQLRQYEDVRVHHDRRPGEGADGGEVYSFLTQGTVRGSLSDVMYGSLSTTTQSMRVRTAYTQDTLLGGAVLESIVEPTQERPFQSMCVRWIVKGVPMLMRAIAKHGDWVILEATGVGRLKNGDQFGYHIMHSVASTKTPPLPQFERYSMSFCSMWRQISPERVQLFSTMELEVAPSAQAQLAIKATADVLIAQARIVECAMLKKLAWLAKRRPKFQVASLGDSSCFVCGSQGRSSHRLCAICGKPTCKPCQVTKELFTEAPGSKLAKQEMLFCLPCLASATCFDATAAAQHDAAVNYPDFNSGSQLL